MPELTNVSKAKVLVTFNGKNYIISSDIIKGKKISNISEKASNENGGLNIITIKFSDGTQNNIYVYNGSQGNPGIDGFGGEQGNTGLPATISEAQLKIATQNENATLEKNVLTIVNDYVLSNSHNDHDKYCSSAWSAYRGTSANKIVRDINETFVSDDEYELLWNDIKYINAEYTTTDENQETVIFANDTNSHTFFKKYWTYEDSETATYYVAIYGDIIKTDEEGNQILDENDQPVVETGIVRYDPVVVNLWSDIYLGETSGYFISSNNQLKDTQPLYVYDEKLKEYVQISIDTEQEITVDGRTTINTNYKDKDFNYYCDALKAYVHAHYSNASNIWSYDLAIDENDRFIKPLYIEDPDTIKITENEDGTISKTFELMKVDNYIDSTLENYYAIDYSGRTQYYSSDDKSSAIKNITKYLATSDERCFVKTNGKYEEIEYETLSSKDKEACIDNLEKSFVEYMFVSIDQLNHIYTFTHHYNDTYRMQLVRKSSSAVFENGNITIYSYFANREYYTSEMKEIIDEVDESGNKVSSHFETKYNKITIPSWIYAEFTTEFEDEEIIVLNSTKELGNEDKYNEYIDITAEDYEEVDDIEIVPIQYMVYMGMQKFYEKSGMSMYDEVSFNDIDISGSTMYYNITGKYVEISGEDAIEIRKDTAIYKYDSNNDIYLPIADNVALELDETYYVWNETRTPIADIAEYVKTQNITIFTGVPRQLPIRFMPENATNKIATIDYDSDLVTMFEDGRICAIGEQLDDNNETHTTLTITPKEGNPLVFNITILTPANSIEVGLGEEKTNTAKINIGEDTTIECIALPSTTSNKRVDFSYNDCIEIVDKVEDFDNNKTIAKIVGLSKGITMITAEANDGFGAKGSCEIEIVKPVTSIDWDQEIVKAINYNDGDIMNWRMEWMSQHPGEQLNENDVPTKDDIKEYRMTLLKDVEYEIIPKIEPSDCSYPELEWTTNDLSIKIESGNKIVVDSPEESYIATQEDVDNNIRINSSGHIDSENGLLVNIGEKIILKDAETHLEKQYLITGTNITYVDDNEVPGYNSTDENAYRIQLVGELKDIYGQQTNRFPISTYVVVNQSVETIEIDVDNISFNIGTSKKFTATIEPDTAIKDFHWMSDNENVVAIDAKTGIAVAVAPGTAKIYAIAEDGSGKTASCDVLITVPMNDINFKDAENGIIYIGKGKSKTINASLIYDAYSNVSENTKLGVDWSTSDASIVEIDDYGKTMDNEHYCTINGVDLGTTTIIAKAKDNSGTIGAIQIMVIEQISSLSFSDEMSNIAMDINDSLALMPAFEPETASNQVLSWTSSDNSKATVNNSGIVTAMSQTSKDSEGNDIPVVITATTTDGSALSASCNIIIN